MRGIIYKATNTFNGKVYIGQTVAGLPKRRQQHYKDAKNDESNLFHFALYQYPNGFTWEVVDSFEGDRESVLHALNVAEEYHILKCNSTDQRFGYNSTGGGYSSDKFSEHIKKRMQGIGGDAKPVLQYDLNGNFIREFSSLNEVAAFLNLDKVSPKDIITGIHYSSQWRMKKNEYFPKNIGEYRQQDGTRKLTPIIAYDAGGMLVKRFVCVEDAERETGISASRILYQSKGKTPGKVSIQERYKKPFYFFRDSEKYPQSIEIEIFGKKTREKGEPTEPIPVLAYDAKTGIFVAEYPSIAEAYRTTRVAMQTITCFMRLKQPYTIISPKTKFVWVRKEGEIAQSVNIVPFVKKNYEIKMEHRIIQYTLDGEFVKVWDNTHQAAESGADTENLIRKCLTGKRKSPKLNYQWAFYTPDFQRSIGRMEKDTPKKVGRKPKEPQAVRVTRPDERIEEVDKSGKVVAVYRDTADAAEKSGFSQSYICNVLAGRIHYPKRKFRRAK